MSACIHLCLTSAGIHMYEAARGREHAHAGPRTRGVAPAPARRGAVRTRRPRTLGTSPPLARHRGSPPTCDADTSGSMATDKIMATDKTTAAAPSHRDVPACLCRMAEDLKGNFTSCESDRHGSRLHDLRPKILLVPASYQPVLNSTKQGPKKFAPPPPHKPCGL